MKFNSIFDQPTRTRARPATSGAGDFRSGAAYLATPAMDLAVSAASATQRPLLVTGPAGCGKSSLARSTAARLGWRYLERTVNSRTEINSLLWDVDQLRRLQDAHAGGLKDDLLCYVRPSVLWQALDTRTAADPLLLRQPPPARLASRHTPAKPAVVLIDEIDKADPDLPNNLLEVLGGLRFEVADTGCRVTCSSGVPLIVITSNDERDLPPAFVRRCIVLNLQQPDLAQVAALHFPKDSKLVLQALRLLNDPVTNPQAYPPSAAEFLDFIQACKTLKVRAGAAGWLALAEACVLKGRAGGA